MHSDTALPPKRLLALDAARGTALVFSILSHFGSVYFRPDATQFWRHALAIIGMIATPTFLIISGLLLGFLYRTSGAGFDRIRIKFVDRGLFLLIVGHLLICGALYPSQHTATWSLSTDVIGVALLVGPTLIVNLGPSARLAFGALAYLTAWIVAIYWMPTTWSATAVEEVTFGSLGPAVFPNGTFPLLPWVGVYIASSVYGERMAVLFRAGAFRRLSYELAAVSTGMLAAACCLKLVKLAIHPASASFAATFTALLRVGQKYPPGPEYLLFYGGLGLAFLTVYLVFELRGWCGRLTRLAATYGEASLCLFVAHFYILWIGLYPLPPGSVALAPAYFLACMGVLTLLAIVWRRRGYNRFLTVGYLALMDARSARSDGLTARSPSR